MTTERNAQGVDVLAAAARDADHANRYRCIAKSADGSQAFPLADVGRFSRESDEARAAVAELVEAANEVVNAEVLSAAEIKAMARLIHALKPFQSEAES